MNGDLAERYADWIVSHSALVVVALLVVTAAVAAGAAVGDTEDGGIGEFEVEGEEADATDYIEENYGSDDRVIAQIVVRDEGGDVLTRESLLDGLYLQRDARANESVDATIDEDGFVGIENVVGTTAYVEDRIEGFEERGEELGERQAELGARSDALEDGLNESREIQREYEELSARTDEDDPGYQEGAAELEAAFDASVENATTAAELDDEGAAEYEELAREVRGLESVLVGIERASDDFLIPEETAEYQEVEDVIEGGYAAGTIGLLEAEFERLEHDAEALEADREAFEESDGPTLEEAIEALEARSDAEVDDLLADLLDHDEDAGGEDPTEFLPADYEPGETEADSRVLFLFQVDDSGEDEEPEAAYEAQLEVESLFEERFDDGFVFGQGISDEASANAVGDSFGIITPVALVLVLGVLAITYRDLVDVLLGVFGIGVVLAWLAGLMGWLEIPMSQLLIAVPFLLIGLGIDYSLHVVMRYREARAGVLDEPGLESDGGAAPASVSRGIRGGMALGLGGLVLALAATTFSTGVGFLSNVVSPLPAIRDFAVLSAGGIFATFVAFGVLVPALKVEVDGLLENRLGRDRAKPPFGVTPGPINAALSTGVTLARRAPVGVILLAVLLASAGAYGATGIDTEFNEADFLPEDAPEWAKSLPGPLAAGTYTIADDAEYLAENFQDPDSQSEILIRGDVTDPETLVAIDDAVSGAGNATTEGNGTIDVRSDGSPAIETPLSVLEEVAAEDEEVAAALSDRDTNGDGVPDEDVEGLYDVLFDADEEAAASVIERTDDGEYESALLLVSVRGDASAQSVAEDVRPIADAIESATSEVSAVATGGPVTNAAIQDALLETLVQAFAVTLVVILAFLTLLYWVRHRAASLGAVTLAPVVVALAWLLGTMAVLDIPFNSETAVITSLAIGLGVDYSIHVGERFVAETERTTSLDEALSATMTGTGGALLGSAATTASGFGVLALALAPPLQRFGLVTGLAIVYAFIACLTVLPCLLVVRERLLGD